MGIYWQLLHHFWCTDIYWQWYFHFTDTDIFILLTANFFFLNITDTDISNLVLEDQFDMKIRHFCFWDTQIQ